MLGHTACYRMGQMGGFLVVVKATRLGEGNTRTKPRVVVSIIDLAVVLHLIVISLSFVLISLAPNFFLLELKVSKNKLSLIRSLLIRSTYISAINPLISHLLFMFT